MFSTFDMTTAGLRAQRTRMDTIAGNVLNAETTRNSRGEAEPYRRRFAVLAPGSAENPKAAGVHVKEIAADQSAFTQRFEPNHPDANPDTGLVAYPNIDMATEQVNLLEASRAYEAAVSLMQTTKSMFNSSLRMIA
ncbi:MAG: flagellar basal body rod protein FlgC [Planctomycetota bacterium]